MHLPRGQFIYHSLNTKQTTGHVRIVYHVTRKPKVANRMSRNISDKLGKLSIFSKTGEEVAASDVLPTDKQQFSLLVFLRNFA